MPGAYGQSSTVYLTKPVQIGARGLALGGAMVSDNYDISGIYWNPATLAFLETSSIILSHSVERSSSLMSENLAIPLFIRKGETVGISFSVNHVGHLTKNPDVDFNVIEYGYDVAYSRRVFPTFSVGGAINVRYAVADSGKLWGVSSSVGLFYNPAPSVSYGIMISGIGTGILLTYDGTKTLLTSRNLPRSLLAGATLRYPAKPRKTILTLSVANEKIFIEDGIRYSGGIEVLSYGAIYLRAGYTVTPVVDYAGYGVGITLDDWVLDFGIQPSALSSRFYQLTVSMDLWDQTQNIF